MTARNRSREASRFDGQSVESPRQRRRQLADQRYARRQLQRALAVEDEQQAAYFAWRAAGCIRTERRAPFIEGPRP